MGLLRFLFALRNGNVVIPSVRSGLSVQSHVFLLCWNYGYFPLFPWLILKNMLAYFLNTCIGFLNLHQIVTAIYKRKNSNLSLFFWNFYFSFEVFSQRNGYESFFHATHKHKAFPVKSLNPLSIQKCLSPCSGWDLEQRKVLTHWHHMAHRCPYSIIKYSEHV